MGDGLLDVGHRLFWGLLRQAIHQIQIKPGESGLLCQDNGLMGLLRVMNPSQLLQMSGIKTLNPQRKPRDATGVKAAKLGIIDGARIGFQRDFQIRLTGNLPTDPVQQLLYGGWGEGAGSATAHKEAMHRAWPGQALPFPGQIGQQGRDIGRLRDGLADGVGIEIAIGTFAFTPRDVNIQRQRKINAVQWVLTAWRAANWRNNWLSAWPR